MAVEYGYKQREQKVVWLIFADKREKLVNSYEKLAKELSINYQWLQKSDQFLSELSRQVYNALEDRKQEVLLVLDDAVDLSLIRECLLHKNKLVKVLITTRNGRDFKAYNPNIVVTILI